MTIPKDNIMSDASQLAKALRRIAKVSYGATIEEAQEVSKTQREAADLIERVIGDLPQDAIDGGWTALGMSKYAKGLETQIETLQRERDEAVAKLEARSGDAVAWMNSASLTTFKIDRERYPGGGAGDLSTARYMRSDHHNTPLHLHPPTGDAAGKDSVDAARYRYMRRRAVMVDYSDEAITRLTLLKDEGPTGEFLDDWIDGERTAPLIQDIA